MKIKHIKRCPPSKVVLYQRLFFVKGCLPSKIRGGGQINKKITAEIVATNIVASRPPDGNRLQRRPLVPTSYGRISLGYMISPIPSQWKIPFLNPP